MGHAETIGLHHAPHARPWCDAELAGAVRPFELIGLEALEMSAGVRWGLGDLLAVGLAGALGAVAVAADPDLAEADLDVPVADSVARPFALLQEIRAGRYDGVSWERGVRDLSAHFGLRSVTGPDDALVLWLRELLRDAVAPLGIPEPGWARLFDLPVEEVRHLAHTAYADARLQSPSAAGSAHPLVTATLSTLVVEVVLRTHVHWHAFADGAPEPSPAARHKLDDMLLAAHALAAAATLTPAAVAGLGGGAGPGDVGVLVRSGLVAVEVVRARRARHPGAANGWTSHEDRPWNNADAPVLAVRLDRLR